MVYKFKRSILGRLNVGKCLPGVRGTPLRNSQPPQRSGKQWDFNYSLHCFTSRRCVVRGLVMPWNSDGSGLWPARLKLLIGSCSLWKLQWWYFLLNGNQGDSLALWYCLYNIGSVHGCKRPRVLSRLVLLRKNEVDNGGGMKGWNRKNP